MSGIWSRKLYDAKNLEKQNLNYSLIS